MKKIVIIGANDYQNPLILKAKENGYETHVFAWKDGSIGEKTADFFYPISIVEKEKILEECQKIQPDAVISIGSDLAMMTVNYLAKELKLIGNSIECTEKTTNKYKMREALKRGGIKVPQFVKISEKEGTEKLTSLQFPLIVKPTDRSGSRGVTKVYGKEALCAAIKEAIEYSFEKNAIVEEYIEGPEYSCECISYQGKHHFLAITKKYTTGEPHFIETAHVEPSDLSDEMIEKVKETIFKALDALEIQNGASHSEFRINEKREVRLIEIGARMGGDCIGSDLVPISTGYDFVQMVLDVALGKKPDFTKIREPKVAAIKFIFGEKEIRELEKLQKEHAEYIQFVSPIADVNSHKIVDSSTRYGFYILAVNHREQLANLL